MINWKRGLGRLAVAWLIFWGCVGLWGYWRQEKAVTAMREMTSSGSFHELAFWNREMNIGADMIQAALLFGAIVPIPAVALGILVLWVHRGFRTT